MLDINGPMGSMADKAAKTKTSVSAIYRRLLGYAWQYKGRLILSLVFAWFQALSFGAMFVCAGVAVNTLFSKPDVFSQQVETAAGKLAEWAPPAVVQTFVDKAQILYQHPIQTILALVIALVALTLLGGIARYLQEYFAGSIGAHVAVRLADEMYENMMNQSLRFFEQHSSGELLARLANDVFAVNRGLSGVFVKLMREPFKAIVLIAGALWVNPTLTLSCLIVLPPVGYIIVSIGRSVKRNAQRSLQKLSAMQTLAKESLSGMPIIKGFCMEPYEVSRMRVELRKLDRFLVKMVRADAAVGPLSELLLMMGVGGFLLLGAVYVERGYIESGDLVYLLGAFGAIFGSIRSLTNVNNQIQTSMASAERVFEYIDMKPEIVDAPDAVAAPPLRDVLGFNDVRFSYDGQTEVLRGINLQVKKGEMVALVGFSGAGKSTLVKLIPRFYDVTGGSITLDGVDIRTVTQESLRGQISIVTQDSILFNESIRENIAHGKPDYTDERIRAAAKAAHAEEFIAPLPNGYETPIGESGSNLSGGQRQRLAIARAIVKDPAILILDEATSSLDSESEQAIQKAMDEFVVGRTTLVIAHRLSTIQRADRIVVLEDGLVAEEGTHRELIDKGGIYRRLYEIQFATAEQAAK
ncbi:MAG: ABC transporter ATP-binding protein [FCB group bacterium]|jgi:subfamily B ATP-binding cassette protein MsbA|nr:ABC transporter ATP-binding protein [FCB group bacterium]